MLCQFKNQCSLLRTVFTLALASLAASASAAMALCNCTGSLTSFLLKKTSSSCKYYVFPEIFIFSHLPFILHYSINAQYVTEEKESRLCLHFHALRLHAPRISSFVQGVLHHLEEVGLSRNPGDLFVIRFLRKRHTKDSLRW
jgi:hypothetical protein